MVYRCLILLLLGTALSACTVDLSRKGGAVVDSAEANISDPNASSRVADPARHLIPAPRTWQPAAGTLNLADLRSVLPADASDEARRQARNLAQILEPAAGHGLEVKTTAEAAGPSVHLRRDEALGTEAYRLNIRTESLTLTAGSDAGFFYGLQTLRQLLLPVGDDPMSRPTGLRCGSIDDGPAYPWRGMLLDCGRHFMDVAFIKGLLDWLALHKFNVLHWHLTEDQGWRLEVPGYPRLTEVAAWRTDHDGSRYGGFYTTEQVREIVAYAAERHITVVPEIEMPGHCVAALAAYPELSCTGGPFEVETQWGIHDDVYCAGNEATFAFLEAVLRHVMDLFPSRYIHIGGDECPKRRWRACPRCRQRIADEGLAGEHELQNWFIARIAGFLADHGRRLIGWDEISEGPLPPGAVVQAWRNTHGALVAVRQGHDAIVSPTSHAYFDYDVSQLDLAQVYSFDPLPPELVGRRSDSGASTGGRILGGEMNLWTEYVPQERVYAKLLPRATAMAECLWTSPTRRDFPAFLSRWYDHRQRLAALGYVSGPADRPLIVTATATDRHGAFRIAFQPHDEIRRALDGTPMSLQTAELDPQAVPDFVPGGLPENLTVAETVWNPMPDEDAPLHLNLPDGTRRLVLARLLVMDRPYGAPALVELSHHVALNRPVAFGAAPSSRFPTQQPIDQGGGLTDGLHGSWNFRDGHWAGFEGTDLEARVDLGDPRSLRDVSIRFIQDANAWVWLPQTVEVLTSIDGTTWRSAGQVDNRISDRIQDKFIETFTVAVTAEPVAWVRVVARNRRTCPDWHPGAGQPCWLFADELVCRQ